MTEGARTTGLIRPYVGYTCILTLE